MNTDINDFASLRDDRGRKVTPEPGSDHLRARGKSAAVCCVDCLRSWVGTGNPEWVGTSAARTELRPKHSHRRAGDCGCLGDRVCVRNRRTPTAKTERPPHCAARPPYRDPRKAQSLAPPFHLSPHPTRHTPRNGGCCALRPRSAPEGPPRHYAAGRKAIDGVPDHRLPTGETARSSCLSRCVQSWPVEHRVRPVPV